MEVQIDNDWACLQVTVIEGEDLPNARRILITATAAAENTGMQWKDAEKTSVGKDWGKAPSVVEGVVATIRLPGKKEWQAWSLDERGVRRDVVPVREGALRIGPELRTLWYEMARGAE
jgi:hypothetical protein